MKELLQKPILKLPIDKKIKELLSENQVNTVYEVCSRSRMELANEVGLTNLQINDIIIYLQLQGLDLKPNHAKRNTKLDTYVG